MEELVGEIWHKLITRKARTDFSEAQVTLESLHKPLGAFYRALGGERAKRLEAARPRALLQRRNWVQRIAGSHTKYPLSWQDTHSVRLPETIAVFPDPDLNRRLYFWLAALAAQQSQQSLTAANWLQLNQHSCRALIRQYPGLAHSYHSLVKTLLALRAAPETLPASEQEQERQIRQALQWPGAIDTLPDARFAPQHIPLWLYPADSITLDNQVDDLPEDSEQAAQPGATPQASAGKRKAQRIDAQDGKDGLIVFRLESLFSWSEHVNVDRCEDDSEDEQATQVADDLDIITLSRQRQATASKVKFDLDLPAAENDDLPLGDGILLPEWDYRKHCLIPDNCRLQPMLADRAEPVELPPHLRPTARKLQAQFSQLKPTRIWQKGLPQGSELDLDSWLQNHSQPVKDTQQNVYKHLDGSLRDLSCLLLADFSLSTDAYLNEEQRVIDVIRDALYLFAEALDATGDRFALYGFSSLRRQRIRFNMLKNFGEPYSAQVRGRINAIRPGYYTRMGGAIRQATRILREQPSQQRILLLLSDGKPNDLDHYESRYGIEDTRQAVVEARQAGLIPFCVTIDDKGNDYLPYLFGSQGYVVVRDPTQLPRLLPKLYLNLTG